MLQDDYKRIMDFFQQGIEGKPLNVQELCNESVRFFDTVKQFVERGTPREKEEALAIMTDMYQRLLTECKQLTQKTGLSETQLLAFAENPANFTPDQWKLIQETRTSMIQTGSVLADHLKASPAKTPPSAPEAKKKIIKPKKDKWLRS